MDKYKEFYEEACRIVEQEDFPEYVDDRIRYLITNLDRITTLERSKDGLTYYCAYCGASICAEYANEKRCIFCESKINS